ncbi:Synapse-associated protein 1 [Actinomortierella wolfii]|nr:Synapse-associated protein 1 [Actinomortierella wolfii]
MPADDQSNQSNQLDTKQPATSPDADSLPVQDTATVNAPRTSSQEEITSQQQKEPSPSPTSPKTPFGGFSAPSFFSSMQGKLQTTLATTKTTAAQAAKAAQAAAASATVHQPPINLKSLQSGTEHLAQATKGWGLSAFKSLSTAAQQISANVTQGFEKEHEQFLEQKKREAVPHLKQGTEAVPVWAGVPDEDQLKARILSLSKDKRNFLLPPPPGTDFVFDMNVYASTAIATLREDANLDHMRFYLVPREVEEHIFWRNYFYRVSLLKQAAIASAANNANNISNASTGEPKSATTPPSSVGAGAPVSSPPSGSTSPGNLDLGYNIYFGEEDVAPPSKRSSLNATPKRQSISSKPQAEKKAPISEVLFEADMPKEDEDPDAWLEKQLASGGDLGQTLADEHADVDVADWEKELQNELKDYVEDA